MLSEAYVKAIYDMHTKSGAAEAIDAIKPRDSSKTGVEIAIDEWGPAVVERIAKIRAKLNPDDAGHQRISKILDKLEATYLKDGYQEVLRSCIPRDSPVVLSHNDA